MPHFQSGEIPPGFTYTETGTEIHYRNALLLTVPQANQPGDVWGDLWLSFGSAWGDVKLGVNHHDGTSWSGVTAWDIPESGSRVARQLPSGTQKISIGRWKTGPADRLDNLPAGWLIEYL